MKRIIISVTNDLSTDQRVSKICNTLQKNNFDILLIGRVLKNSTPVNRNYKTKRISLFFNNSVFFYIEFNIRLFFILFFSKKDILLSNDLDTLSANYVVSFLQRKKLVYDSHELFSEIPELVERPLVKSVWVSLENFFLPKVRNSYTVCKSIAEYYNKKYKTNFKIVRNFPTQKKITKGEFNFSTQNKRIIIYQGAINVGRGLELMIKTMNFLPGFLLVIIGSGDIFEDLKKLVTQEKLENQVYFLGRLIPEELQKLTPLADLGISIEENLGLNYTYALPNKIFDYVQAEVPVLVSNLPEMKQIVREYKIGEVLTSRDSKSMAKQIKEMLLKDYSSNLKKAKNKLIWEKEEKELLSVFNNLK